MSQERQIAGIELRLFAGVIASDVPRMFLIGIAPLLLSAYLNDRDFGEESASWLSSGELLASAVAVMFLVFPLLAGLPSAIAPSSAATHERSVKHVMSAVAVSAALFDFTLGQNAVWGFTARIGQSAGLSAEEV